MKKILSVFIALSIQGFGQIEPALVPAKDRAITSAQTTQFFQAIRAVTGDASKVVYTIFSSRTHIGYGISVGDGKLIAKWSEIAPRKNLVAFNPKQGVKPATVIGAYPDHDLVLLSVKGLEAPAAVWVDGSDLPEGSFLAAVRPDGEASGIGVKSVAARSLREEDQGFLGVQIDPRSLGEGVEINAVVQGSAAAKVGLRRGDVLLAIGGGRVKGFQEVSTRLRRLRAGETPQILFSRAGKEMTVTPKLQGSQGLKQPETRRLKQMNYLSGLPNRVRDDFSNVVQSDMELSSVDTGLPVIDLDGRIVGLVIARAGRISTLILPSSELIELLKSEPYKLDRNPRRASERQDR